MMANTELFNILKAVTVKLDKPVKLASGRMSDYYIDVKKALLTQQGLKQVSQVIIPIVKALGAQSVGGIEAGSIPLVAVVCAETGIPAFFVRKHEKGHGLGKRLEGNPASPAVIIEDVTTSGTNSLTAVKVVRKHGYEVAGVISVVDRNEGAREKYARRNIPFYMLYKSEDLL